MKKKSLTLLDRLRAELHTLSVHALYRLAVETEISYDTIRRIRDGKTDPAFGKVQRLADQLKLGQQ